MTFSCGHEGIIMFVKDDIKTHLEIAKWERDERKLCLNCWKETQ